MSSLPKFEVDQWIVPSTVDFLHSLEHHYLKTYFDTFLSHWSLPENGLVSNEASLAIYSISNDRAASRIAAACFLRARHYFMTGKPRLAIVYVINAGFLTQVIRTSLSKMRHMLDVQFRGQECREMRDLLPDYKHVFEAIKSSKAVMKLLAATAKPSETVLERAHNNNDSEAVRLVFHCNEPGLISGGIRPDWVSQSWSPARGSRQRNDNRNAARSASSRARGAQGENGGKRALSGMDIVFRDDETGNEVEMQVPRDVPLKQFLRQYAEDRSTSVSKMQFSVKDEETGERKFIFASDMGRKTTEELRWTGEKITVFVHLLLPESSETDKEITDPSQSLKKNGRRAQRSSKAKNQKKKGARSSKLSKEQVLEKCRLQHSRQISEVFAEASKQFTEIRNTINAVNLERMSPKARKVSLKKALKKDVGNMSFCDPSGSCGGKAGITRYVVRIGEVAHLYKTSKPIVLRRGGSDSSSSSRRRSSIDLHGLTRKEAVDALDERLPGWVEDANMVGCPWVTTVEIVVGGGNQVLSEAVRQWIRGNDHVARAPATGCV